MILARSPLRITFGGGGTDLPSYSDRHGGFVVSGAIDKYVYVTLGETFQDKMLVRYSQIEWVTDRAEIRHPIIREALRLLQIDQVNLEITTIADIPAGTGLGSSGSFTTALLKALYKLKRGFVSPAEVARMACHIEIDLLREPVGRQDQFIAAFGGLTVFDIDRDGEVKARPVTISDETYHRLTDNLILFATPYTRSAGHVLKDQDQRTRDNDQKMVDNLHRVKELGQRSLETLETGDLHRFGELMHEHWEQKRVRSPGMSNGEIDRWYGVAREHGAAGGKLIGAGGGGFLMFYTERPEGVRAAMRGEGLRELRFGFDFDGTKLLG
jgi:D-glycero-alpha-D-manno-heptose-7-phosphate kinase